MSQKSQFDRVQKIENENKNLTRASLFQSSEDTKHEIFLCDFINELCVFSNIEANKFKFSKERKVFYI